MKSRYSLKEIRELLEGAQNYLICTGKNNNETFNNFISKFEITDRKLGILSFKNCKNSYEIMRTEFTISEILEMYNALED